jgi:hypothetical protein
MYHPSWFDAAACKNQTDLFFPLYNERPQARVKREAKALMYIFCNWTKAFHSGTNC